MWRAFKIIRTFKQDKGREDSETDIDNSNHS